MSAMTEATCVNPQCVRVPSVVQRVTAYLDIDQARPAAEHALADLGLAPEAG